MIERDITYSEIIKIFASAPLNKTVAELLQIDKKQLEELGGVVTRTNDTKNQLITLKLGEYPK